MLVVIVFEILLENLDDAELVFKGDGPVGPEAQDSRCEEALAGVEASSDVAGRPLIPQCFEGRQLKGDAGDKNCWAFG